VAAAFVNELIHQPTRLKIMATLNALRGATMLEFTELQKLLDVTPGNLGTHLTTLESAGYVAIEKSFVGKKPRTRVALTSAGWRAFNSHVQYLRDITDAPG
jgi:DNA-binding MarR family transcriptional regulator